MSLYWALENRRDVDRELKEANAHSEELQTTAIEGAGTESRSLSDQLKSLNKKFDLAKSRIELLEEEVGELHDSSAPHLDEKLYDAIARIESLEKSRGGVMCALSDDVVFGDIHGGDIQIKASDLNAAAVGTLKRTITCHLKAAQQEFYHDWAQLTTPAPVPSKGDVTDVNISAPTIVGTPAVVDGVYAIELLFDTDAGATKIYVVGEQMSLGSIKVAADDLLPTGQTVAGHSVTISII